MWMQIGEQAKIGDPSEVSLLSWQVERFHGAARNKAQSHCHRLKQNTWPLFKRQKKASGYNDCSRSSNERRKTSNRFSRTIKEQLHLPTILHTTHVPNTSTFSTTSCMNALRVMILN